MVIGLVEAAKEFPDGLAAGVLVTNLYIIMMGATSERRIYVYDCHNHIPHYEALVALSGSSSADAIAKYLLEYFQKHFELSDIIVLQTGQVAQRDFHFGLLLF